MGFTDSIATIQLCSCSKKQLWAIVKHRSLAAFSTDRICFCKWPGSFISGIITPSLRVSASTESLRFLLLLPQWANQPTVVQLASGNPVPSSCPRSWYFWSPIIWGGGTVGKDFWTHPLSCVKSVRSQILSSTGFHCFVEGESLRASGRP